MALQPEQPDRGGPRPCPAEGLDYVTPPYTLRHRPVLRSFHAETPFLHRGSGPDAQRRPHPLADQTLCHPRLRAGYLTACAEVMRLIRAQRMPWSVNALAVEAGFYALDEKFALPFDLEAYLRLKDEFAEDWRRTGPGRRLGQRYAFLPSPTAFGKASALKDFLARRHGILIRDASNFEGLDAALYPPCHPTTGGEPCPHRRVHGVDGRALNVIM